MNLQDRKIETLEAEVIRLRYSNAKLVEELEVAKADTARLDQQAALQSALEGLARVTKERDGLAAVIRSTQEQMAAHPVLAGWRVKPGAPEHLESQVATIMNQYHDCVRTLNNITAQRNQLAAALLIERHRRFSDEHLASAMDIAIAGEKVAQEWLAGRDRQAAVTVLRAIAPQINEYDGKALLYEAVLYERGEREVPGE